MLGYTHKFQVQVNGQDLLFEPDEERNYRAFVDPEQVENSNIDVELLKAIAERSLRKPSEKFKRVV